MPMRVTTTAAKERQPTRAQQPQLLADSSLTYWSYTLNLEVEYLNLSRNLSRIVFVTAGQK